MSHLPIEAEIIERARKKKCTLCTVESCTGGKIADRITEVSGASEVFWGAFVVYDNTAKISLGVQPDLLARHGAVSAETAHALAQAGLAKLTAGAQKSVAYCVSTTGIAGPSGGTPEKPVGLCYVALASNASSEIKVRKIQAPFSFKRTENKRFFSEEALKLLLEEIKSVY